MVSRSAPQPPARDDGFSLVEIVVAMVVLSGLALGAAAMLVDSLGNAGDNRSRVRAANLAAQQIDQARAQIEADPCAIVDAGVQELLVPVGGTTYTVRKTAAPSVAGQCGEGTLTVSVSWPDRGNIAPVVSSALLTPLGARAGAPAAPVPTAPPVIPDIPITLTCELATSRVALDVDLESILGTGPMALGLVTATRTASGACKPASVVPIVLDLDGKATVDLEPGAWTFTVALHSLVSGLNTANLSGGAGASVNMVVKPL